MDLLTEIKKVPSERRVADVSRTLACKNSQETTTSTR